MKIDLPYVKAYKVRGNLYTYYRRDGHKIRVRGNPESAEWKAAYHKIHDHWGRDASDVLYGSVGWLIQEYRLSPEWAKLADATRASYGRYLVELREKYKDMDWRTVDRPSIIEVRDKHKGRRSDYYVSMLSILGELAIDKGLVEVNPAKGVKKRGSKTEWRAWDAEELLWFEGTASREPLRLAYFLALYTGQRLSDVLAMIWHDIKDGVIKVTQSKTGAESWIPIHKTLAEVLEGTTKRGIHIVAAENGRPYTANGFTTVWRREILECGLDGVQFHGLRKNASVALAEAGCSENEIMAVTGHKTHQMVALYTRSARQKLLAQEAMRKLSNRGSV